MLKLIKIAGWTIGVPISLIVLSTVLFIAGLWLFMPPSADLTWRLREKEVVNFNKYLAADEVCIFQVGYPALREVEVKYPNYKNVSEPDWIEFPKSSWTVVGIRHQSQTFKIYTVFKYRLALEEIDPLCSSELTLRIKPDREDYEYGIWFASVVPKSPEGGR
jgi:hypothetical protein